MQASGTRARAGLRRSGGPALPRSHPDGAPAGAAGGRGMRDRTVPAHQPAPGAAGQSAALPGHGHAVHAHDGSPAAPQAGAARQSLPRAARAGGGEHRAAEKDSGAGEGAEARRRRRSTGRRSSSTASRSAAPGSSTSSSGVHRAGHGRDQGPDRPPAGAAPDAGPLARASCLLAEEFLGNINEEGYLAASLEEIVGSVNRAGARRTSPGPRPRTTQTTRSRGGRTAAETPVVRSPIALVLHHGRGGGDARHHPEARPARRRRARPARVPADPAPGAGRHRLAHLPPGARGVSPT